MTDPAVLQRILRPEHVFALIATLFGLTFLVITPPFQVPDEINHFYRAYQISEGHFLAVRADDRVGGYIPSSLIRFTGPFLNSIGNRQVKADPRKILDACRRPLDCEAQEFADFPNTSMYSPASYMPQSVSMSLVRLFDGGPFHLFYAARIGALLFWITCISVAIRILPFHRWSMVMTALLPMSVWINMSMSADVVSNALSFLLLACLLNLAYIRPAMSCSAYLIVLVLSVLLASAKIVYTPIILLFLLIPRNKFRDTGTYYGQLSLLAAISTVTVLYWSNVTSASYVPYTEYNEEFRDRATMIACADMREQMRYILDHGPYIWSVFSTSLVRAFNMYSTGYIGTFAWLDTRLPVWLISLYYILLFIVAIMDGHTIRVKWSFRVLLLLSGAIIMALILLSQHLIWDCVGGDAIANIQGRYLIPLVPLLFMACYRSAIGPYRYLPLIVMTCSLSGLSFTAATLVDRFYPSSRSGPVMITCDAEDRTDDGLFRTSDTRILLENAATRSTERARSGAHAARLDPHARYAFIYRLYNGVPGDTLRVGVWRHGTEGRIRVAGGDHEFLSDGGPFETDADGWQHILLDVIVLPGMAQGEIGIHVFYEGQDSVYFDDLSISHR